MKENERKILLLPVFAGPNGIIIPYELDFYMNGASRIVFEEKSCGPAAGKLTVCNVSAEAGQVSLANDGQGMISPIKNK